MSEPTEPERLRAEATTPIADDLKDALRRQACGTDHVFYKFREMERALSTAAATADKLREENEELKSTISDQCQMDTTIREVMAEAANLRREVEELKAERDNSNILLRAGTAQLGEMVEIVKESHGLRADRDRLNAENEKLRAILTPEGVRPIIRAISDPGAFTPRGDNRSESISGWSARAVQIAIAVALANVTVSGAAAPEGEKEP